jgi:hypothetical protein
VSGRCYVSALEYPPLLKDDVLIPESMAISFGPEVLNELFNTMWRGDCQTCGASLVAGSISFYAETLHPFLTSVSLHHATCQPPEWNDATKTGVLIRPPRHGKNSTYVTSGFLFGDGIPAVIMNPHLEIAHLKLDESNQWKPSPGSSFGGEGMIPGGPKLAGRENVIEGARVEFTGDSLAVNAPPREWLINPGANVADAAKKAGGFLAITSSLFAGQQLSPGLMSRLLTDAQHTHQGWVLEKPPPAKGAPAVEYAIFRNHHYAVIGFVVARNIDPAIKRSQAIKWAKQELGKIHNPERLIDDTPGAYSDERGFWTTDAISGKMYSAIPATDGWRLIESYSRYGGSMSDDGELLDWANRVLQLKSPHRTTGEWTKGPQSGSGDIMLFHAMPTEA